MRRVRAAVLLCGLLLGLPAGPEGAAAGARGGGTPSGPAGWADGARRTINPADRDYGAALEDWRRELVVSTIDDLYFWTNVVTLILVSALVLLVLLEWRAMEKREIIASSLIARLWNGRVADRAEIESRTEEFNRLAAELSAQVERRLSRPGRGPLSSGIRERSEELARRETEHLEHMELGQTNQMDQPAAGDPGAGETEGTGCDGRGAR